LFWDWLVTCKIQRSPSADIYIRYFSETPRFLYYIPRYIKIGKILAIGTARKYLPYCFNLVLLHHAFWCVAVQLEHWYYNKIYLEGTLHIHLQQNRESHLLCTCLNCEVLKFAFSKVFIYFDFSDGLSFVSIIAIDHKEHNCKDLVKSHIQNAEKFLTRNIPRYNLP
jgi:hypothetical protein